MRNILSMDLDWKFKKESDMNNQNLEDYFDMYRNNTKTGIMTGAGSNMYNDSGWETVSLPHDWVVRENVSADNSRTQGYKPQGAVWYRKGFLVSEEYCCKTVYLKFDGIAIQSDIYLNNIKIARSESGYTPILVDITDFIRLGKVNILAVRCDNREKEGWWYEGGGIYRHVYLVVADQLHFKDNGIFVSTEQCNDCQWKVLVRSELTGDYENAKIEVCIEQTGQASIAEIKQPIISQELMVDNPRLWNTEEPNLYSLKCRLFKNNKTIDKINIIFGFRKVSFDSKTGCILNGDPIKLKGVCIHHDHAGVGVAIPDELYYYRIKKLKDMGCNAIRTSHNPQSKEFYDACDKLGILVMNETRHFSSTMQCLHELKEFVRRDRNHACVIMWSIFNEEPLQGTPVGENIARSMIKIIREHDDTRAVTGGMNGPFESEGVIKVIDVMGFNYLQYGYDEFHQYFPHMPIVGSETGSYMSTRGIVKADKSTSHVSCYGNRLGENLYHWSDTPGATWEKIISRPYVMGGFYWTGFDYRGETGPFNWPGVTSNFGAMDLCGFPKDNFYWHRCMWKEKYQIYLSPHWNFQEGEQVEIICYSNCEEVELILNGRSIGIKANNVFKPEVWMLTYESGTVKALGKVGGSIVCETQLNTAGSARGIRLKPHKSRIFAGNCDVCVVDVSIVDQSSNIVVCAEDTITFDISGAGKIIGIGNGDNANHYAEKGNTIKTFGGRCQVLIQADDDSDKVMLTARSNDLKETIVIYVDRNIKYNSVPSEKCVLLLDSWRMSDVVMCYPSEDDLDNLNYAWIPTAVGNGKNLMLSNKKGYAVMCAKCSAPVIHNQEYQLIFEGIKGKADIYINGCIVYEKKEYKLQSVILPLNSLISGNELSVSVAFRLDGSECGIYKDVLIRVSEQEYHK